VYNKGITQWAKDSFYCCYFINENVNIKHKRSQGVQWVHLHPQGGEKEPNLQGKCVSAPQDTKCTPGQSKSQFLGQFLLSGFLEEKLDGL